MYSLTVSLSAWLKLEQEHLAQEVKERNKVSHRPASLHWVVQMMSLGKDRLILALPSKNPKSYSACPSCCQDEE
jgi:hypothetical protein